MISVNEIELDFDVTSPSDMLRYTEAIEQMKAESNNTVLPSTDPDVDYRMYMKEYVEMLNSELRIFGNFIDNVFGDGVAMQLLGSNPSLNKVAEVDEALGEALEAQGREFGVKLAKYKPNRATRRAKRK